MCVVSLVIDHYHEKFEPSFKWNYFSTVSRAEFEALKTEVENMKVLLKKANIYDEENGQPDCSEKDEKIALLKRLAKELDIDLEEI